MIVVVVPADRDLLRRAEIADADVLQLHAQFLADDASAGDHGDVLEDGLASIAEARRLHGGRLQRAAQLVHDQRGERLAFEILGDDQERPAFCRDLLEHAAAGP